MTQELVMGVTRQALEIILIVSFPLLGASLMVGILVSLIQAATQIQEPTLTFVPKIITMFIALLVALPWMMNRLISYTTELFNNIPKYIQ